jgi:hypothetical protein
MRAEAEARAQERGDEPEPEKLLMIVPVCTSTEEFSHGRVADQAQRRKQSCGLRF